MGVRHTKVRDVVNDVMWFVKRYARGASLASGCLRQRSAECALLMLGLKLDASLSTNIVVSPAWAVW